MVWHSLTTLGYSEVSQLLDPQVFARYFPVGRGTVVSFVSLPLAAA
jgi:hypothetical protein